ncbi:hypothetical protein MU516_10070 [Paracoccus sp. YLB-12]|uniref:Lipoprotein n=1 Tax=Paracoccus maritimus TaxID=2933292 RepID=A0ABT2K9K5_9RHOB|nr:hypothetical protein [Paracoccus sp. YLB-12]MCT4333210.1 hypothetical protein [Paracoccus sp. YLB-12]
MNYIKLSMVMITVALAGCASDIMKTYVGKDITEAAMDYGVPNGVMDLPDGRRAFIWQRSQSMAMPTTTNYNATAYGNWVSGTATTTGGGVNSWECTYTLIGQKNPRGSYTVVDFRKPSLACE